MNQSDNLPGLTSADRRQLARMADTGARPFARRPTATADDGDQPEPDPDVAPPQHPTRNLPKRHRALAEELRHRDGVEVAHPTAEGVAVQLAQGARLPPWVLDKAALDDLELRTPHGPVTVPDGDELRRRRERAGLAAGELADRLGIGAHTLRKVERGVKPVTAHRAARWREACEGGGE